MQVEQKVFNVRMSIPSASKTGASWFYCITDVDSLNSPTYQHSVLNAQ
jgi:hypothetical protein